MSYLKQDGNIKTATDKFGNLFKRKQMDKEWISDRLKDAVGKKKAELIQELMESGDVGSQLVNIKKNGVITIDNLDVKGNKIKA